MGKKEEAGDRKGEKRKWSWGTSGGKARLRFLTWVAGEMVKKGVFFFKLPKITQNTF